MPEAKCVVRVAASAPPARGLVHNLPHRWIGKGLNRIARSVLHG
jgi:hypothetical protein